MMSRMLYLSRIGFKKFAYIALAILFLAGGSMLYAHYRKRSQEMVQSQQPEEASSRYDDLQQRIESIRIWSEIMMFHLEFEAAQRSGFRAAFDEMDPDGFNNRFAIWELIGEMASEEQAERMRTIRNLRVRRSDVIRANRLGTQNYLESGGD